MGRVKDTGYVNPQDVYNYLVVNKGLSREHALGMLANIQGESGFKISIQEYGKAAGTGGVGLYQHTGSRRTKLMQYTGGNISDWTKQVDFALQEADTKRYLAQTFKTPEEASIWFTTKWERPANAQQRAQERLKYLNNYSSFSGYESEYVPTTNTSTDQAEQTGGIPPQTVIPFEVVIAGQPVQANFSYEEFEKALLTVKKTEEKTEESPARQELEEQTTTQEEFLKAISSLSAPPASDDSAQGASQQQGFALGTGPYTPVEIPEMQGQLPQMPNLFSTQLPQMRDGGPTKTIDGVQYVQDEQGNWKYASGAPVTDRALAQRLQYEPNRPAVQNAPKPKTNQAVWESASGTMQKSAIAREQQLQALKTSPRLADQEKAAAIERERQYAEDTAGMRQTQKLYTLPQSAGSADGTVAALALGIPIAPAALSALGSLASTPLLGSGVTVGTAVNTGFGIYGATQVDDRVNDWRDVYEGNMDWREATAKSLMTGLEVAAGLGEIGNLTKAGQAAYINSFKRAQPLIEDTENILETIDLTRPTRSVSASTELKRPVWVPSEDVSSNLQLFTPGRYSVEQGYEAGREIARVESKSNPEYYINLRGRILNEEPQVYFNASMPNQLEAGRAFKALERRIPKGTMIVEPNSLSLDSYMTMLKRGLDSKKFTALPGEYVPLNKSAVHNLLPNQNKILDTESPFVTFENMKDAEEAATHINSQMPSKFKALKAVVLPGGEGEGYNIMIRTLKLRKEFKKGGKVSAQDTKEMVDGIAQILAQVNNAKNRSDIARNMIYDFEQEGLNYNLHKFLRDANVR